MSNTIAFIGLGHMGKPMALNLLKAGHSLKVFDLNAEAMKELQEAGPRWASRPCKSPKMPRWSLPCCPLAATFVRFMRARTACCRLWPRHSAGRLQHD